MSGTVDDLVEEIVANVYQDGVFVVRNGRHHRIEPREVATRWSTLIDNEISLGNFRGGAQHKERLFAWVRDHQVAFVWMDLKSPPDDHRAIGRLSAKSSHGGSRPSDHARDIVIPA